MIHVLSTIWFGFWTGFGVELSVLLVYLVWKLTHSRIAHKLHADHWFHKVGEYFD